VSEFDVRVALPVSNIDPFDAPLTEQEGTAGFSRVRRELAGNAVSMSLGEA
jgi:hypothetical protein